MNTRVINFEMFEKVVNKLKYFDVNRSFKKKLYQVSKIY